MTTIKGSLVDPDDALANWRPCSGPPSAEQADRVGLRIVLGRLIVRSAGGFPVAQPSRPSRIEGSSPVPARVWRGCRWPEASSDRLDPVDGARRRAVVQVALRGVPRAHVLGLLTEPDHLCAVGVNRFPPGYRERPREQLLDPDHGDRSPSLVAHRWSRPRRSLPEARTTGGHRLSVSVTVGRRSPRGTNHA